MVIELGLKWIKDWPLRADFAEGGAGDIPYQRACTDFKESPALLPDLLRIQEAFAAKTPCEVLSTSSAWQKLRTRFTNERNKQKRAPRDGFPGIREPTDRDADLEAAMQAEYFRQKRIDGNARVNMTMFRDRFKKGEEGQKDYNLAVTRAKGQ